MTTILYGSMHQDFLLYTHDKLKELQNLGKEQRSFEKGIISNIIKKHSCNIGICQAEDGEEYQILLVSPEHQTRAGSTPLPEFWEARGGMS